MLKFSHFEDEKKETGQHRTQEMCKEAVKEGNFSLQLLLDHFMLKFGHRETRKKRRVSIRCRKRARGQLKMIRLH